MSIDAVSLNVLNCGRAGDRGKTTSNIDFCRGPIVVVVRQHAGTRGIHVLNMSTHIMHIRISAHGSFIQRHTQLLQLILL